ncbi:MAG: aspartate kinase [Bacteroidetes bacterium]|uniref:Aspartokinase n=1 Tax=Candidatus Cryptobacteroides gallistercoris TaxID=2840765 RepID=A0A940DL88_9BACT|nr:aspartate kinase [Candidatus Cryptobacteroides gallistercoris]
MMKFGGTSVANSDAVTRVISTVRGRLDEKPVVVVSALSKVTDLLYKISDEAARRNRSGAMELLGQLRSRHLDLAGELMPDDPVQCGTAKEKVNEICDALTSFVDAVCAVGELSPRSKAIIISNGEYLSSNVICCAMNASGIRTNYIDARRMIVTDDNYLKGDPDMDAISSRAPGVVLGAYEYADAVITQGFVSATAEGEPTVLGRGGSDYSASLIGMAIDATRIEIWTDVDGVRTADPRRVENTKCLDKISFEEAAEMAHFGAKVLHPLTIEPAVRKNIPIYVLNSMNPEGKGTAILQSSFIEDGVKSVSCKENILVINIFSTKMINTSGFLKKVFAIFSEFKVSVDLISTSEANISVTVDATQDITGVVSALSEFADVYVDSDKSQVSVIGKNIVNLKGLLEQTFAPLRDCKIYMISQGASYVNISFVVDRDTLTDVVRQIHKYLFEVRQS